MRAELPRSSAPLFSRLAASRTFLRSASSGGGVVLLELDFAGESVSDCDEDALESGEASIGDNTEGFVDILKP